MSLLITGGAGFIGSHVVRLFVQKYPDYHIINLDALTYAGNLENLKDIEQRPNYTFVKGSITDPLLLDRLFTQHDIKGVIHLAAESHVYTRGYVSTPLCCPSLTTMQTGLYAYQHGYTGESLGRIKLPEDRT